MSRFKRVLLLAAAATACAALAPASDSGPVAPAPETIADREGPVEGTEALRLADAAPRSGPRSPLMAGIAARLERMRSAVAELEARAAAAPAPDRALALQQAIERAKVEAELDILRLQADEARREGRLEQAASLEAALREMTEPRPRPVPSERPERAPGR